MKQLLQSLKTGATQLDDIPCPQNKKKHLLIQTKFSLISAGTERMLVEFGKSNWIEKARQQPDKVKQVLNKIKTDGLLTTIDAVKAKLDQAIPMGYANVGVVLDKGVEVDGFVIGDRVVSNGPHAEMVSVVKNLCAKIPDNVTDEEAVFTVVGAIALQGIRLSNPTLGESFVVMGLGLIGLLTVQLLRAQGCRVLATDFNQRRLALAKQFGAEIVDLSLGQDILKHAEKFSRQQGVDGVLITASTTSNDPIEQAAKICRKRGRIVLVGVTGLTLSRADFYEKELSFQVSCSYGPGRYDPSYEELAHDYPIGFVRWTEQRNFEAFLDLLAMRMIDVKPMITHIFDLADGEKAYEILLQDPTALGILLHYPEKEKAITEKLHTSIVLNVAAHRAMHPNIGLIGAGNYAGRILAPILQKSSVICKIIAANSGANAIHVGKKYGFQMATTDVNTLFEDPALQAIIIATQHNTHAALTCRALAANKHVFVEKPLCLTQIEFDEIRMELEKNPTSILMVGFNRRFAPQVQKAKQLLQSTSAPRHFIMTVNAGFIPKHHWTQNKTIGGGRLIGEVCHFVDLLRYLAGCSICDTKIMSVNQQEDQISLMLKFSDGSVGVIHYLSNGHSALPKERLEIFVEGKIISIHNFRKMQAYGFKKFSTMNLWRQNKGQSECMHAFLAGITLGEHPIPVEEIFEVQQLCLALSKEVVS